MFTDNGVILSPYNVLKQSLLVIAPKNSMLVKLSDNMAKANGGYSFTGKQVDVAPYSTQLISVMYDNQSPLVVLTEATRQIKVSHWGNI